MKLHPLSKLPALLEELKRSTVGSNVTHRKSLTLASLPDSRLERQALAATIARLDASRNDETGGTGLGLAIARSAIRAHGGEIRLATLPQGGLRAEVVLPGAES